MKNTTKVPAHFDDDAYDAQDLFFDACTVVVALVLIGMVLFAIV
ncbi:hypothetical protein [Kangiella sediminilitoris]|uniref:Uncharacterized protein n=1 Tax=Kangiella sediminilitoris TaxID=1144748 RepID=A0A1B3B867_9GAMM|nr:hypothetical protein [Kangiella sediminilitoris]AOE48992.1 hypothetical protein KS2013_264 [Kangiella sediminilitoris]